MYQQPLPRYRYELMEDRMRRSKPPLESPFSLFKSPPCFVVDSRGQVFDAEAHFERGKRGNAAYYTSPRRTRDYDPRETYAMVVNVYRLVLLIALLGLLFA